MGPGPDVAKAEQGQSTKFRSSKSGGTQGTDCVFWVEYLSFAKGDAVSQGDRRKELLL